MTVKIGCCGFPVSKSKYMARLKVVEIQQTFYQLPKVTTAKAWRTGAPPDFEFTLKAWQLITHDATSPTYRRLKTPLSEAERQQAGAFKPTDLVRRAWEATREIADALEARLVVFQCPARFDPSPEHAANLRNFFGGIERRGLLMAWEPRGDWPRDLVEGLCKELDLLPVVDPFATLPYPGPLAYFRLHGKTGYRYKYTEADLTELAGMVQGREEVYVMFNNLSMWEDAQAFAEYLQQPPP
jgi:uncharacterized protein YecE (DUF72 family)|uniref:DUF72 domain-containing protein n=1 Tax=Desulfobacca acetoxidans TaxID=60893 RepID=A0A7C3WR82_9BACT